MCTQQTIAVVKLTSSRGVKGRTESLDGPLWRSTETPIIRVNRLIDGVLTVAWRMRHGSIRGSAEISRV